MILFYFLRQREIVIQTLAECSFPSERDFCNSCYNSLISGKLINLFDIFKIDFFVHPRNISYKVAKYWALC